ncbi:MULTISPECIES: hypothetical protein [unclassified Flavobacterium]|uniref:hypothetical protein n=1 Tax=unclassified Flavobacterium TaxID=196869 RepID=UPI00262FBDE5|nr:hypothetical protein [Flavobacterium sp.]
MKKIGLLFLGSILLFSCGRDNKKEEAETSSEQKEVVVADNYAITLDAIYEKDDELLLVFKKAGYWDYDHPTKFKIVGQPNMQNIKIDVPQGLSMENVQVDLSSNKEQKYVTIKGINVLNNGKVVIDGSNNMHAKYFDMGNSVGWDPKGLRYIMNFGGEYPPRMVGNEQLEAVLVK